MDHLTYEQLLKLVMEDSVVQAAQSHLENCNQCREQLVDARHLLTEMQIARHSEPGAHQRRRYYQLFAQVQREPSHWSTLLDHIRLALSSDSRRQSALAGLRSGAPRSYRLLYTGDLADVELLVEPSGNVRHIEGEVVSLDPEKLHPPALIELVATETDTPGQSTESTEHGRFSLDQISTGYYNMVITPAQGPSIRVGEISIT